MRTALCRPTHENVEFEPEQRFVARGASGAVDIALFDFTREELKHVGKQALAADLANWPPPHPFSGQSVFLAGFPSASRMWIGQRAMSF